LNDQRAEYRLRFPGLVIGIDARESCASAEYKLVEAGFDRSIPRLAPSAHANISALPINRQSAFGRILLEPFFALPTPQLSCGFCNFGHQPVWHVCCAAAD
jgi:hypothetical protein